MKAFDFAGVVSFLCLLAEPSAAAGQRVPGEPAAVVYELAGEAVLTVSSQAGRPLRLFDRLPVGAGVKVGAGSRLAVALMNGLRYELGEHALVTFGPKDLSSRSGPVRSLPKVPPLPRLAPIAAADHPGPKMGAVRIRGERIAGLYPCCGVTTLAGDTVLRFEPVEGGGRFRIEVQDRQGDVVFTTETATPEVRLPVGILRPGKRYDWTVRTIERVGAMARGEAGFVTLASRDAARREALRRAVETEEDGSSLALLAEVDRSLGLLAEACEGLRAALRDSPGDAALAASLAELERRLSDRSAF